MKKGMILYRSKYGAAKKYAGWMAEATGFDITEVRWANPVQMQDCGTVLLFGGIYASGIAGLSFFRKHWQELRGKQLAVFCVGASPYEENAFRAVREHNMRGELAGIPVFYGRGAWDQKKMTFLDRTLCGILQKSVEKKDPAQREPWMEALLCAGGRQCDWTDRKYLSPLLDYLGFSGQMER